MINTTTLNTNGDGPPFPQTPPVSIRRLPLPTPPPETIPFTPKPQVITAIPKIDYRKRVEERFGKPLVEQYLNTYFSSYKDQIQNNDPLIFVLLARLARRNVNLERVSQREGNAVKVINQKLQIAPLEREVLKLNEQGSYKTAQRRLFEISERLHSIDTIGFQKKSTTPQYKLYSLAKDNPLIPPSLLRKIGFVATAIIKLFCRLILRQDNWNEIPAKRMPEGRKLLLGSIPNSLSDDATTFQKNGVQAVLSLLEPFEHEKRSLSRPYSVKEWEAEGITQGWIEAKDHQPLNPEQLHASADFIHEHLKRGNVYVHCRGGAGRSNMAIAAYLMKYCQYSVEEAKTFIMSHRKQSSLWKPDKLAALNLFKQEPDSADELKKKQQKRLFR